MSGEGRPEPAVGDTADLAVAIVAARWHHRVMQGLLDGAHRALHDHTVAGSVTVRVPGSFELPVAAAVLADRGYDAVVALGVVIRGGTPHFDYVCSAAAHGLTRLSVDSRTVVGFGLLTCDDEQQALDRAGLPGSSEDKGHEATTAALATAAALRAVGPPRDSARGRAGPTP